jgi:tRNA A64-2'-O-ribosylphosphate transferase
MADTFPRTLSDLNFRDDTVSPQSLYRSMRDLRKATLSIPNRLRSVLQDAEFVQHVVEQHSSDGARLPLIANERCGSWYIPPDRKVGSAYFKSTDGHFGQWDFSLRRLNLQVLGMVGKHEGAVIVDSTRRGKNMPDALAKTVPIWVAVMNRVLFPDVPESHAFQRPPEPYLLGDSEVSQIEGRLDGFVKAFKSLDLHFETLRQEVGRPMKLLWRVNNSTGLNRVLRHDLRSEGTPGNHYPLILCSASRRVVGAEMSEGSYVQGAGDDSEGWSCGLTPALFWQHKDELFNTPESELESLISMLIVDSRKDYMPTAAVRIAPTSNLYIAKAADDHSGMLGQAERNAKTYCGTAGEKGMLEKETGNKFDFVISCNRTGDSTPAETRLNLTCRTGKLGSRELREKLPLIRDIVRVRLERDPAASILVTCETGKDLCVGVALMLLSLFYDDEGRVIFPPRRYVCSTTGANDGHDRFPMVNTIDKSFIRRRLAWIGSSNSDASPSRTTLQSVNAFLIGRPG